MQLSRRLEMQNKINGKYGGLDAIDNRTCCCCCFCSYLLPRPTLTDMQENRKSSLLPHPPRSSSSKSAATNSSAAADWSWLLARSEARPARQLSTFISSVARPSGDVSTMRITSLAFFPSCSLLLAEAANCLFHKRISRIGKGSQRRSFSSTHPNNLANLIFQHFF